MFSQDWVFISVVVYFCSSEGFMSYMMDQPQNVPENAHFVGHVGHTHSSPIDIEGEEGDDEDGDGVRTVSHLIWKQEEDEKVVSMQSSVLNQ
jgi:hypothetical protein